VNLKFGNGIIKFAQPSLVYHLSSSQAIHSLLLWFSSALVSVYEEYILIWSISHN
jgi:hypothetical protein